MKSSSSMSRIFSKALRDASCLPKRPSKEEENLIQEANENEDIVVPEIVLKDGVSSTSVCRHPRMKIKTLQEMSTPKTSKNKILCNSSSNEDFNSNYVHYINESHNLSEALDTDTSSKHYYEKQIKWKSPADKLFGLEKLGNLQVESPSITSLPSFRQESSQTSLSSYASTLTTDTTNVKRRSFISSEFLNTTSIYSTPSSSISTPKRSSESQWEYDNKFSPLLKRSSSATFEDLDFTPKRFANESVIQKTRYSIIKSASPRSTQFKLDKQFGRRSFPIESSSRSSFRTSEHRSCAADQTPLNSTESWTKGLKKILPSYSLWNLMSFKSDWGFIDAHCHLDFLFQRLNFEGTFSEYRKQLESTFPECYQGCIAVFCNPFTFAKKSAWLKFLEEENIWAAFGCHPHNSKNYNDKIEQALCEALTHSKVHALGEIGLDYSNRNNCLKEVQQKVFKRQLKIAKKQRLPLVIHCREAHEDCMEIMQGIIPYDYFIHLHCFTDSWTWAQKWLETFPNLFIGITNVVTFPSAESVHEVAKNIPLDRLLLETDAPYFLPRLIARGRRWSHPGMAVHVAAQIAALKNVSLGKVLKATSGNTRKLYHL